MTLDPVVRQRIDDVVKEFADKGRMCKSFEISFGVNEKGLGGHRNMRSTVQECVSEQAEANYARTLRDVEAPVRGRRSPLDQAAHASHQLGAGGVGSDHQ